MQPLDIFRISQLEGNPWFGQLPFVVHSWILTRRSLNQLSMLIPRYKPCQTQAMRHLLESHWNWNLCETERQDGNWDNGGAASDCKRPWRHWFLWYNLFVYIYIHTYVKVSLFLCPLFFLFQFLLHIYGVPSLIYSLHEIDLFIFFHTWFFSLCVCIFFLYFFFSLLFSILKMFWTSLNQDDLILSYGLCWLGAGPSLSHYLIYFILFQSSLWTSANLEEL